MKRTVDLETNIDGDPRGFNTAARSATEHARRLERANAQLENRLKKMNLQLARSGKSASLMRGELLSLAAAGAAVSPAVLAAGAGAVAFAALAAPAIMRVVKAQEDLVGTWDTLSDAEKSSAVGLRAVISQYKALARSLEPETLGLFNQSLQLTSQLMPRLAPLARAVSGELTRFVADLNEGLDSPEAVQFFEFLETSAGPATRQLGDVLGSAAGAAASLTQTLAPLAGGGLAVVGVLLDLVGAASSAAPGLTQLAILTLALRGPVGGLGDMLGTAGTRLETFGAGAAGARGRAQGLGKALSATGAVLAGPWGIAVTAAVGLLGMLIASSSSAAAEIAEFEAAIRSDSGALGANTRALVAQKLEQEGLLQVAQANGIALSTYTDAILGNKDAHAQVAAQLDAVIAANKAKYDSDQLSFEGYKAGISGAVELRRALRGQNETVTETVTGLQRQQAAQQAGKTSTDALRLAWQIAGDGARDMKDRVDALSAAFDAYFNPALAALAATNRMKDAVAESSRVLGDAKATGLDRTKALESQLGVIRDWASAELRASGSTRQSSLAFLEQLPALQRLAGGSREGRAAVAALAGVFGATITRAGGATVAVDRLGQRVKILPNGKVIVVRADTGQANAAISTLVSRWNGRTITVNVATSGANLGRFYVANPSGKAAGGMIRGPGSGTSDSIPILASNGEYVINARSTARHRELLEAINTGRFARGGIVRVRGYASGGAVGRADVPVGEYVSRFMEGKALSRSDYLKVVRSQKDAVDQLRRAERKLAADRKAGKSARTIADDEARVAKERRDLATATERLGTAQARYNRAKLSPTARLTASLNLGIANTSAFVKNLETIAKRGYPELARQLLAMGGPEAEKYAADAARLTGGKLAALNARVQTAARAQSRLESLPNILAVQAARKAGARSIPEVMKATGLSEDDLKEVYAAMGYAKGGIHRYARGGLRPGPGIATRPTVLFGEGRGPEGYVPYDPAHRPRAMGLVSQIAADFGMTRAMPAAAAQGGVVRVVLDTRGADAEMLRVLRKIVKVEGGGNVQAALGRTTG